ncbi:hypothetical protein LZS85_18975, partial [Aliivibrio fischeri]|uniref:hypothetical protein n=1 Tax=Aliivibrio fischeri TaxID=668 RepID=UPI001F3E259B
GNKIQFSLYRSKRVMQALGDSGGKVKKSDVFNCAVVEIFHLCLENFPIDSEIVTGSLAIKVMEYFEDNLSDEDFFYQFTDVEKVCTYTLAWLKDEGYIRFNAYNGGEYRAILTEKGLNASNSSVHANLSKKSSFKDIFSEGISKVPFSVLSAVMVEFFKPL